MSLTRRQNSSKKVNTSFDFLDENISDNSLEEEVKMLSRKYNDLMASFIETEDQNSMNMVANPKGLVSKAVVTKQNLK